MELDDGIIIDNIIGIFVGSNSPIGLSSLSTAPIGSRYFRVNGEMYVKTGATANDWILRLLQNNAVASGTYTKVSVDVNGLITSLSNLLSTDIPNITESQVTNLVSDLAGKQSLLVSGTNIKTINSQSILGSGNLAINASAQLVGVAETNITTTSTSDVLMTGMTITPTSGTYLVLASCTSNNSGNNTNFISVYSGGVQVSGTQQSILRTNNNLANARLQYVSNCQVTVNGSQAIDMRWRVSTGTGTCYSRYLTIIKVG